MVLEEGWTEQVAENGRRFFIDHFSNETTWIDPRIDEPSNYASLGENSIIGEVNMVSFLGDSLPDFWVDKIDCNGNPCFKNFHTDEFTLKKSTITNPHFIGIS